MAMEITSGSFFKMRTVRSVMMREIFAVSSADFAALTLTLIIGITLS
jgi:hypothetical protein